MRAKARKTIKTAKRTSWQQYVSKLNSRTPAKKIWDMIRKITGKNKITSMSILNQMEIYVQRLKIFPMH